jgi:hypothetical protein
MPQPLQCITGSRALIGLSSKRQKDTTGAPVRSEPKLGNAWAYLPSAKAGADNASAYCEADARDVSLPRCTGPHAGPPLPLHAGFQFEPASPLVSVAEASDLPSEDLWPSRAGRMKGPSGGTGSHPLPPLVSSRLALRG